MRQGDILELTITGVNNEGEGVVRTKDGGFVLFVPDALPGEKIAARVVTLKRNYGMAKVLKRHCNSQDRTAPRCPAFGRCGGCQLQHMSYEAQLRLKTRTVRDALERIGGIDNPPVEECVPSPHQWGYRNKASLPVQCGPRDNFNTGFYKPRSHDIIPFSGCPVLLPRLERLAASAIASIRERGFCGYDERHPHNLSNFIKHIVIRTSRFTDDSLCGIVTCRPPRGSERTALRCAAERISRHTDGLVLNVNMKNGNFIWGDDFSTITGSPTMTELLDGRRLKFEISSFFQINSEQTISLYKTASEFALADSPQNILELYSGVGSLTVFLARGAKCVTAVESWEPAAKYMMENAEQNGLTNIMPYSAQAEDIASKLSCNKYDAIVLDPPRTGCAPEVINSLLKIAPPKIVYVSCNPATLARDLKPLTSTGYRLTAARTFDMFPQTGHVETVCLLSKIN